MTLLKECIKNFLKENNTAKTKGQIDNLWERMKDRVFEEIDVFAKNSLKQREMNKFTTNASTGMLGIVPPVNLP